MANQLPIQGPSGAQKSAPIQPGSAKSAPDAKSAANAVAFRALLDDLEVKARELGAKADSVGNPTDLAGAMQGAKSSLDDALSIRDRLLEAFRQAETQHGDEPNATRGI